MSNLRKAKSQYIQRQQEYEKAREAAQKLDTDHQAAGKVDKKRKLEDDAMHRVHHSFHNVQFFTRILQYMAVFTCNLLLKCNDLN